MVQVGVGDGEASVQRVYTVSRGAEMTLLGGYEDTRAMALALSCNDHRLC